jgi:hypothetical protein
MIIIIRKPKFMRSDIAMQAQLTIANALSELACMPEVTPEERYEYLKKTGECLNKAAKAGGFLNVGDMCKWMELHSNI